MKDSFDVMADVISLIDKPEVTNLIDGSIWSNARPDNSSKTDIVVGCSAPSNEQRQVSYGYVNIYVPVMAALDGAGKPLVGYGKMKTLGKVVSQLLDTQFGDTFQVVVEEAPDIERDTDGSLFVHISFQYSSYQTDYKNI